MVVFPKIIKFIDHKFRAWTNFIIYSISDNYTLRIPHLFLSNWFIGALVVYFFRSSHRKRIFFWWNPIIVWFIAVHSHIIPHAYTMINLLNLDFMGKTVRELSLVGGCRLFAAISNQISIGCFLLHLLWVFIIYLIYLFDSGWLNVQKLICTNQDRRIVL